MKPASFAIAIVLSTAASLAAAERHCDAPVGLWQSREAVHEMARERGWTLERIRIDDGCYEVRGIDADGRAFKARIDPETLRVMKLKTRDQRERHHHRDEAGKTSGNAHESHASNVTSRPTSLPENAPCPAP